MPKTCKHESCHNNVFGGGYCNKHQYLRTDKKPKKVVERKPIRQISSKQRKLNDEYSDKRKLFIHLHPLCKAKLEDCTVLATDIHHKKGRGKYLLDIGTWISVCRSCHQKIEENPKMAKELNLSESRLN